MNIWPFDRISRLPTLILTALLLLPGAARSADSPLPATDNVAGTVATQDVQKQNIYQRLRKGFSLHKSNYLLPLTWGNRADNAADAELKFQISFKQNLWDGFYFAYTQKSSWRWLDSNDSRPFRETNYNPEIFWRHLSVTDADLTWGGDIGFEHESNGAREPTSRSWNRLYLAPTVLYKGVEARVKLWYRLQEDSKDSPTDTTGDENPDIEDYYGYGELSLAYTSPNGYRAAWLARQNFATDKGGMQFELSMPSGIPDLHFYAQIWTGYGETLIDYNRALTRYGVGLLFRQPTPAPAKVETGKQAALLD